MKQLKIVVAAAMLMVGTVANAATYKYEVQFVNRNPQTVQVDTTSRVPATVDAHRKNSPYKIERVSMMFQDDGKLQVQLNLMQERIEGETMKTMGMPVAQNQLQIVPMSTELNEQKLLTDSDGAPLVRLRRVQ